MTEHRRDSFTAFLVAKGRKDGIVSLDSDYGLGTHDVIEACADLTAKQADACLRAAKKILRTDPRDAEIAALKAEVERLREKLNEESWLSDKRAAERDEAERSLAAHKRALAAGPAALRAHGRSEGHLRVASMDGCAEMVEAAQEAAMKEGM